MGIKEKITRTITSVYDDGMIDGLSAAIEAGKETIKIHKLEGVRKHTLNEFIKILERSKARYEKEVKP